MPDYYGTLAGALAHHTARGNAAWGAAATDALREGALLRASDWLDGTFRTRFPGWKKDGRNQLREWPRSDVVDREGWGVSADVVPREIERATYEAALRELVTPGSLSPDFVASQQIVSETVGPISTTYRANVDQNDVRPVLHTVEDILSPLLGDAREVQLFGSARRY